MRLDEVRQVEAIPVLGTGKTDYKVLRAMIG
jgi:long-chain-fatty-acid--[acyl-carrier-protein] ligase